MVLRPYVFAFRLVQSNISDVAFYLNSKFSCIDIELFSMVGVVEGAISACFGGCALLVGITSRRALYRRDDVLIANLTTTTSI